MINIQNCTDLSWVIGGAQGSGVDSVANILAKAYAQCGLYIFGKREYYSNIKGEHSYFTIRVSSNHIHSHLDDIDILVTFDAETIFRHIDRVKENGIVIYDKNIVNTEISEVHTLDEYTYKKISRIVTYKEKPTIQDLLNYASNKNIHLYGIPYMELLNKFSEKINNPSISKMARMINVISLSSSLAIIGFDLQIVLSAINFIFKSKKNVAEINCSASEFTFDYIKNNFQLFPPINIKINGSKNMDDLILVQGNQASALGKIVAGCRFQTYYPITPASDDSEFLESHQIIEQIDNNKGSILVIQAEDEISAIAMAIGAALSGVRASTATSGPGFSLMVEALGWAGMNEVPLVVSLYQRAGPSTGLPTRHEQGDLLFAVNSGHGEFPKIVYASGDIEESFYDTIKLFNFAEIYQLPVIHMLDKAIANSVMTCKMFDQNKILINRGKLLDDSLLFINKNVTQKYKRFQITSDGISPRVPLGTSNGVFWNTGDEHTEEGHITEDPEIRTKMMDKRMQKLDIVLQEISDNDKALIYENSKQSDCTVISWGSTKGAILDAIEMLKEENLSINFIQIRLLYPFPKDLVEKLLKNTRVLINIEMNYTSQLSKLIKQNLEHAVDYEIVKYNGRPMSSNEIYLALRDILTGRNDKRRIVLDHGA